MMLQEVVDLTYATQSVSEEDEFDLPDAEAYFAHTLPDGTTPSKLLQLPPELLTLIVESGVSDLDTDQQADLLKAENRCLKTVRLVHPLLASLSYVRSRFFRSVHLTPDPDRLRALEKNDLNIGSYVRRAVFKQASICRWDLHPDRWGDSTAKIENALKPRVTRAVQSGRTLRTWTNTLKHCPRIKSFSITASERSMYSDINCGPATLTLLELALQALISSACQPRRLRIHHCTMDEFVYTKLPDWEELDLSRLRELDFYFSLQSVTRTWNQRESFKAESAAVLSLLLHNSTRTLQILTLSATDDTLGALFASPPPEMPRLRSLNLLDGQVIPEKFASWILRVPGLHAVSMARVGLTLTNELRNWQPIFQALRQHPGALRVELRRISLLSAAGPWAYLNLRHQIPDTPEREVQCLDILGEIADMLMLYMSGLDGWNIEDYWGIDYHFDSDVDEDEDDESEFDGYNYEEDNYDYDAGEVEGYY